MKVFKLIVTSNEKCKKVLEYLCKFITDINSMGVTVAIEKIHKTEFDEEMVNILRKRGITRLPVLIAPDGTPFTGVRAIIDLFERNLKQLKTAQRVAPAGAFSPAAAQQNPATSTDLNDFWQAEMYNGADNSGRMIPRTDPDEGQNEGSDLDSRMRDYQSKVPKWRGGGSQQERNIETPEQRRPARGPARPLRAPRAPVQPEPEDNIAADEEYPEYDLPAATPSTPIRAPQYTQTEEGGSDVDQKMMAAWLENLPGDY